ncbi:MAG: hypothetical protein EOM55_02520 [Clostridia bacterium]|nr:hypothetical protein [Clostridia bacterium]NCC70805.1 hypothetical protein [bacterium]
MRIIYCHHANRLKGNPPSQDDDITNIGKKDAKIVAKLFKEMNSSIIIKAIYSSEFFRCTKTANLINKYLNVPIIIDERLNEYRSNKGETWVNTQNRITSLLKEIIAKFEDDECVICVTSGVNIAPFISLAYNIPNSEETPFLGVPSCCPIGFDYSKIMSNN